MSSRKDMSSPSDSPTGSQGARPPESASTEPRYITRAGQKLCFAMRALDVSAAGAVCADLGSHAGGFVDCLLQAGAVRVYSVDTAYGTLAWKLRRDSRVIVLERTNAIHVTLPEPVRLITIDVGWTKQAHVLHNARRLLGSEGRVLTLIKPHYEAEPRLLEKGVLPPEHVEEVVAHVLASIGHKGWTVLDTVDSPLTGHAGNREVFALLSPR